MWRRSPLPRQAHAREARFKFAGGFLHRARPASFAAPPRRIMAALKRSPAMVAVRHGLGHDHAEGVGALRNIGSIVWAAALSRRWPSSMWQRESGPPLRRWASLRLASRLRRAHTRCARATRRPVAPIARVAAPAERLIVPEASLISVTARRMSAEIVSVERLSPRSARIVECGVETRGEFWLRRGRFPVSSLRSLIA